MSDSDSPGPTAQAPTGPSNTRYTLAGDAPTRDLFNQRTLERDAGHLAPRLRTGMRVVDLGCGAASLTLGIAGQEAG